MNFVQKHVARVKKKGKRVKPTQIVGVGFFLIILTGALLLMLPISSRTGEWTDFVTALFTSTSATCVTGLIVVDTYTHWSGFGQCVILLLIQIGGLGFMSIATLFSFLVRRTITMRERMIMTTSLNVDDMSGIVRMTRRVLLGTLLFEGIGAIVLSLRFMSDYGVADGIKKGVFHSVSAFCNAGFDLLGQTKPFSSLGLYVTDPIVNLTIMLLIIIGGIGFYVWNDLYEHHRFRHLRLHTKLVLITTAVLIFGGALFICVFEWNNPHSLGHLPVWARPMAALFESVTLRTAGFETIPQGAMTSQTHAVGILLMLIGGSPGSTAGGIKTVTLAVLVLTARSAMKGQREVTVFGRTLGTRNIVNAVTMLIIGVTLIFAGAIVLLTFDNAPFSASLFEATSAFCTVGLTIGITAQLGVVSHLTLIALMFLGRVGVLTLGVAVLMGQQSEASIHYPETQVFVG